jgi:hypothetical protein
MTGFFVGVFLALLFVWYCIDSYVNYRNFCRIFDAKMNMSVPKMSPEKEVLLKARMDWINNSNPEKVLDMLKAAGITSYICEK